MIGKEFPSHNRLRMNLQGHTLNGLEQNVFGYDPSWALYKEMHEAAGKRCETRKLFHQNPSHHLLERALPCELGLAHRRTVFLPWTCGYRRGATTVVVALEDDPRSSQGTAEVAGGDDRLARTLDDRLRPLHRHARRWTINYDHFINKIGRAHV